MARNRRLFLSLGVIALIALAIAGIQRKVPSRVAPGPPIATAPGSAGAASRPALPDFTGGGTWFNSQPLHAADLQGKVVIVDFWTYSCINCLRTLPYLQQWWAKYRDKGLVIVGVHSPEFDFEMDPGNVEKALQKYGVTWPVVMDNDYAIWKAYANHYWPHKYIADASGLLRYDHIGEGGYAETEAQIRELLQSAGQPLDGVSAPNTGDEDQGGALPITRELYAGAAYQQGGYLGNKPSGTVGSLALFSDPRTYVEDEFYLIGTWEQGDESVRAAPQPGPAGATRVVLRFRAASVNAVLRSQSGAAANLRLRLDGKPVPADWRGDDLDAGGQVKVGESRLYGLVKHSQIEEHVLELETDSPDLLVYSFTFSGN